ncbi:hypothetical protein [Bradyrhizobium genosp. P]|uniref:hypothetical protein n=1 Tax=Bradyrhizobium genosp. P TaxID=83641 RepID=UPI003CEE5882
MMRTTSVPLAMICVLSTDVGVNVLSNRRAGVSAVAPISPTNSNARSGIVVVGLRCCCDLAG